MFMKKGDIKEIIGLAWPVMLANLLSSVTMFLDTLMVGRLGSDAVASVGLATQVIFFTWAFAQGLSTGTVALVARRYGEGDRQGADSTLWQSLLLMGMISIPLMALGLLGGRQLMGILTGDSSIIPMAYDYVAVAFLMTPVVFMFFTVTSALRGVGDTRTPLIVAVVVNVLNFVFNYCLIFGNLGAPRLGVTGAALGTLLAFTISLCLYVVLLSRGRLKIGLVSQGFKLRRDLTRKILDIGLPTGMEQGMLQVGFLVFFFFVAGYGTEAIAAHSIGFRVQSLAINPSLGFAVAATALVGQRLGAHDPGGAETRAWTSVGLAILTMTILGGTMAFLSEPMAKVFIGNDVGDTVALASMWIAILALGMPAIGGHFAMAGSLQGAGDTRWPFMVSMIGLYGVRLPLAFVLSTFTPLGLMGIWLALPAEYYLRMTLVGWRLRKGKWKHINV